MLKFVMRESQKQGAKRRIGLSNVQTCHAWWSGCWYVCCLRLNGLSILPQLYDCRVLCGSKEEILCEEDRDLELQLLNAVKVRNSDKNMSFFFFCEEFHIKAWSRSRHNKHTNSIRHASFHLNQWEQRALLQGVAMENESLKVS